MGGVVSRQSKVHQQLMLLQQHTVTALTQQVIPRTLTTECDLAQQQFEQEQRQQQQQLQHHQSQQQQQNAVGSTMSAQQQQQLQLQTMTNVDCCATSDLSAQLHRYWWNDALYRYDDESASPVSPAAPGTAATSAAQADTHHYPQQSQSRIGKQSMTAMNSNESTQQQHQQPPLSPNSLAIGLQNDYATASLAHLSHLALPRQIGTTYMSCSHKLWSLYHNTNSKSSSGAFATRGEVHALLCDAYAHMLSGLRVMITNVYATTREQCKMQLQVQRRRQQARRQAVARDEQLLQLQQQKTATGKDGLVAAPAAATSIALTTTSDNNNNSNSPYSLLSAAESLRIDSIFAAACEWCLKLMQSHVASLRVGDVATSIYDKLDLDHQDRVNERQWTLNLLRLCHDSHQQIKESRLRFDAMQSMHLSWLKQSDQSFELQQQQQQRRESEQSNSGLQPAAMSVPIQVRAKSQPKTQPSR